MKKFNNKVAAAKQFAAVAANNLRMFKMYKKEQTDFVAALRGADKSPEPVDEMWFELEKLLSTPESLFIPEPKPVPAEV